MSVKLLGISEEEPKVKVNSGFSTWLSISEYLLFGGYSKDFMFPQLSKMNSLGASEFYFLFKLMLSIERNF